MTDILPKNPYAHSITVARSGRPRDDEELVFSQDEIEQAKARAKLWQQGQDDTMKVLRPILENIKHRIWEDELPDSPAWDTIYMQIEQILKESE